MVRFNELKLDGVYVFEATNLGKKFEDNISCYELVPGSVARFSNGMEIIYEQFEDEEIPFLSEWKSEEEQLGVTDDSEYDMRTPEKSWYERTKTDDGFPLVEGATYWIFDSRPFYPDTFWSSRESLNPTPITQKDKFVNLCLTQYDPVVHTYDSKIFKIKAKADELIRFNNFYAIEYANEEKQFYPFFNAEEVRILFDVQNLKYSDEDAPARELLRRLRDEWWSDMINPKTLR